MALINCKECGKEISNQAAACPHCGAKVDQGYKPSGCFIVIIVLIFGLLIAGALSSTNRRSNQTDTSSTSTPEDNRLSAIGACREFITKSLHDPDSAEFEPSSKAYANEDTPGNWTVQRRVRAKNGFGAMRLNLFECEMTLQNGLWSAKSVKELE